MRGRLINLGSQHGIVSAPQDTPCRVSKAGAIYDKAIAVDYAKDLIVAVALAEDRKPEPGLAMDPRG